MGKKNFGKTTKYNNLINNVRINNFKELLLATPYVKGFDHGITEELFLKKLYCQPDFDKRISMIDSEIQEINRRPNVADEDINTLIEEKNRLSQLNELKNQFEKDLIESNWAGARYIFGYSGSGKSTYLGFLLHKLKTEGHHNTYKIDLADSIGEPKFLSFKWTNPCYQKTLGKFASILVQKLNLILIKGKETEETYINHLKNYLSFYENVFVDIDEYSEYFVEIKKYVNGEIPRYTNNQKEQSFYRNIYSAMQEDIFSLLNGEETLKTGINKLLGLIVFFYMAEATKKDKEDGNYIFKKKVIIAIDSLEHYIKSDEVFNEDIVAICELVDEFIHNENEFYNDLIDNGFSDVVKFIVVFRDTTAKMLPNRNAEDYAISDINLTEWFLPASISNKRIEFYKFLKKNAEQDLIEAIETIMNDDVANHSFFGKLVEMYNYNKRRLFDGLCKILDEKSNKDSAKQYLQLMAKVNEYENLSETYQDYPNRNKLKKVYKNAARSSIIRLLFEDIGKVEYFKKIFVEETNADNIGKSYARRILTYINAKKPKDELIEKENYISFYELLNKGFRINNINHQQDIVRNIGKVLLALSNSNKEQTHWCQLVVIKFNERTLNESALIEKLNYCYQNQQGDVEQYGIKITSAGRFFLTKMADFEYFACRYCRNSKPLFFDDITSKENRSRIINKLERVQRQAFNCIDSIRKLESNLFCNGNGVSYNLMYSGENERKGYLFNNKNGNEITHVQRILDSHISYLDHYRNNILVSKINLQDKIDFSKNILTVMERYILKLKAIAQEAPDAEGVYYLGRRKTLDGKFIYSDFEDQLEEAKNAPAQIIWIQKKER